MFLSWFVGIDFSEGIDALSIHPRDGVGAQLGSATKQSHLFMPNFLCIVFYETLVIPKIIDLER